ncbi:hypothetical protein BGX28_008423 [Mortierella sp. GBA30]|nr:hypothetical protein BGX28_008423 [Mortierella sp. GBA30]
MEYRTRPASARASGSSSGLGSTSEPVAPAPVPAPATVATDAPSQESSIVQEIETATHIVVEHHRTGTVKTHVFSSKDGKPSLLGHSIPDMSNSNNSDAFGSLLDDKIQVLNNLILDSLENTRSESLSKVEALTKAVEESENRVATQISIATTTTIENHIKTELVPQLDKIEKLLSLRKAKEAIATSPAAAAASGRSTPLSDLSRASMEPMDRTEDLTSGSEASPKEGSLKSTMYTSSFIATAAAGAGNDGMVLEKLMTIENQVGALCKVVIDGQVPSFDAMAQGSDGPDANKNTTGNSNQHSSNSNGDGNINPVSDSMESEAQDRLAAMRKEMLTFPDSMQEAHAKMQELIEALARSEQLSAGQRTTNTALSTEDETQLEAVRKELKAWKESLDSMMTAHQLGLGNVDMQIQNMELDVKAMDTDYQAWKKTQQQTLTVYLKYMYHVYRRTASVDNRIHEVLEQVSNHTGIEQDQRIKFSEELAAMRSEILSVLTSLPDTVIHALKRSSEGVHVTSVQNGQSVAAVGESASYAPGSFPTEATSFIPGARSGPPGLGLRPMSGSGSRILGMPGLEKERDQNVINSAHERGSQQGIEQPGPIAPIPSLTSNSNPDPTLGHLIQTVESLQTSIASMIEKYSEISTLIASLPPQPQSQPQHQPSSTSPDAPEPPPRDPSQIENRIRILEDLLFQMTQGPKRSMYENSAGAYPPLPSEIGPGPARGSQPPPPAPGYGYIRPRSMVNEAAAGVPSSSVSGAQGGTQRNTEASGSTFSRDFREELESMSRNLTELLNIVTATTTNLSEGQNYLHHEIKRDIQRVIDTIQPPEIEEDPIQRQARLHQEQLAETERLKKKAIVDQEAAIEAERKRLADERVAMEAEATAKKVAMERAQTMEYVSMIPNLLNFVERANYHQEGKADEVLNEVKETKAVVTKVESTLELCHTDVQNILQGCIQDSSVLLMIQDQVDNISSGIQGATNMILKNHMEEAIRTGADVYLMVEDVKRTGYQTLAQQETLEKRLDELHQKQDERMAACGRAGDEGWEAWTQRQDQGLEALGKKHDDSLTRLQALHQKHSETATQISGWHGRHDQDLRDLDECRHRQHDEIKGWQLKLEEDLDTWHRKHDERLQTLEKRHCHCCAPEPRPKELCAEVNAEAGSFTGDSKNYAFYGATSCSGTHGANGKSFDKCCGVSLPRSGIPSKSGLSLGVCCGESAAAAFPYDSNPARHRARGMFEEFLYSIIPGSGSCCIACGRLCSNSVGHSSLLASTSTSGIIVPEPLHENSAVRGNIAGQTVRSMKQDTPNRGQGGVSTVDDPDSDTATPVQRATLPPELYNLLRPYFYSEAGNVVGDTALREHRAMCENLEALRKELAEYQKRHEELLQESLANEESMGRVMVSVLQKDQELITLMDDKFRLEKEVEEQKEVLEKERLAHKEAMNKKKQKLNDRKAIIERLYREGLGIGVTDSTQETSALAASDVVVQYDHDSDAESDDAVEIPRYSLMNEAAEQLRQALEEIKLQKADLHHDVGMLEAKKMHLVDEVARAEKRAAIVSQQTEGDTKTNATERTVQGQDDGEKEEDCTDEHTDDDASRRRSARGGRGISRATAPISSGGRSRTLTRQQKRLSQLGGRGVSMTPSKSRGKKADRREDRVPQLEADIQICKDGLLSETLLSSKTILTEEQFERIRISKAESEENEADEDEVWSLNCDFRVKMVYAP